MIKPATPATQTTVQQTVWSVFPCEPLWVFTEQTPRELIRGVFDFPKQAYIMFQRSYTIWPPPRASPLHSNPGSSCSNCYSDKHKWNLNAV